MKFDGFLKTHINQFHDKFFWLNLASKSTQNTHPANEIYILWDGWCMYEEKQFSGRMPHAARILPHSG